MRKGNILFLVNGLLSLLLWAGIFKAYAGESGGDMAILFLNVIVGFLHILATGIFNKYSKHKISGGVLSVVLAQIFEFIIFVKWGYDINEWIKSA